MSLPSPKLLIHPTLLPTIMKIQEESDQYLSPRILLAKAISCGISVILFACTVQRWASSSKLTTAA